MPLQIQQQFTMGVNNECWKHCDLAMIELYDDFRCHQAHQVVTTFMYGTDTQEYISYRQLCLLSRLYLLILVGMIGPLKASDSHYW